MNSPVSNILFTTNLSENCVPAFEFAASMAMQYKARMVMLHVIEDMPVYAEGRLSGLLGKKQWEEIKKAHEMNAVMTLTAKKSSSSLIREALDHFCTLNGFSEEAGVAEESTPGRACRKVVVGHGDTVEEIISQAEKFDCDLIVMGAKEGNLLSKTSIGNTIKGVLRRTSIPALVVPSIKQ